MIIENEKIIIIHPPRCGGTTIEKAIYGEDYFNIEPNKKHLSIKETLLEVKKIHDKDINDFQCYGLIRHPYHRLKSMFNAGYWNKNKYSLIRKSYIHFVVNVKPAVHEGKSLKLIDYYNAKNVSLELYDVNHIQRLLNKLNVGTAKRMEKKLYEDKNKKYNPLHEAMTYVVFKDDYKIFNYHLLSKSSLMFIPLCYVLYPLHKMLGQFFKKLEIWYNYNTYKNNFNVVK